MNNYEVDFTFFIESNDTKSKDILLEELKEIDCIDVYDVNNDGEDWCVDCLANLSCQAIEDVDSAMDMLLEDISISAWDYHYIKGTDTKEYWQP